MQIEKAYLFARQISAGPTPPPLPENVLFENGIFNPLYLPQGFDFANNIYPMSVSGSIYANELTYPADKLGTATTIRIIGDSSDAVPGEDWTIEDGCITFRHTASPGSSSRLRDTTRALLIPVANILDLLGSHRYFGVRCRCSAQIDGRSFFIQVGTYYIASSTTIGEAGIGNYRDADLPLDPYTIASDIDGMRETPTYISIQFSTWDRTTEPNSFVFQVDKIYASDTVD